MIIRLTAGTAELPNGKFQAQIWVGEFDNQADALRIAIGGGANICQALHDSQDAVAVAQRGLKEEYPNEPK